MRHVYAYAWAVALGAVLLVAPASAQVDALDTPLDRPDMLESAPSGPLVYSKATPRLGSVLQDLERAPLNARRAAQYVTVTAVADSEADAPALEAELVALGFQPTGRLGRMMSGHFPVAELERAADVSTLQGMIADHSIVHRADGDVISPLLHGGLRVGAVDGEASVALKADVARDQFDVDGSGMCIGVLSDSYDNQGGAAAGIASGDLPDGIEVLQDLDSGGSDEGRAMMELAYDVAPGVDFKFHTAFGGTTGFANGIVRLFNAGCRVIVDDVSNAAEPMFQDGVVAQAVDIVKGAGASYFSSAGNSSNGSYEGDFTNTNVPLLINSSDDFGLPVVFDTGELHDFDPGPGVDQFQAIVMEPFDRLRFTFGYDEPSAIAEGFAGVPEQMTEVDFDVFVLNVPSPVVVDSLNLLALSVNNNPGIDIPFEFIDYTNFTGATDTVYVAITLFSGDGDNRIKYINFGGNDEIIANAEYGGSSTTFGHSNAAGAFATGASAYFNTAPFRPDIAAVSDVIGPAIVNGFSSYGGLEIRLDLNGDPIAPEDRMKPDATGSDGDNNTFFGGDAEGDGNPNFFGTSASAPNVAAVAALMNEAAGGVGVLGPDEIYAVLEATADDLKPGFGVNADTEEGYDVRTGFGLINAADAVAAVAAPLCTPLTPFTFNGFNADGDNGTFGEFASIGTTDAEPANLAGCSFIVFDVFTEEVTFSTSVSGVLGVEESYVLATMNGDQDLPEMTLPDGPGAFALIDGMASVGQDVGTVLANADIVAAVVYLDDDNVFGSTSGGGDASVNAAAFAEALAALFSAVADEDGADGVRLDVVAAPNPVSTRGTVTYGVAEPGEATVALYDALGRQVAVLAEGAHTAGRHTADLPTADLPAGVYVVRVFAGAEAHTTRLTVVR